MELEEISELEQLPPEVVVEILRNLSKSPEGLETIERFFASSKRLRELRPFFERELEKEKEEYYYPEHARKKYYKKRIVDINRILWPSDERCFLDPRLVRFMQLNHLPKLNGRTLVTNSILVNWWAIYVVLHTEYQLRKRRGRIRQSLGNIEFIPNQEMWELFRDQYQSEKLTPGQMISLHHQWLILDKFIDCPVLARPPRVSIQDEMILVNEQNELDEYFEELTRMLS